VKSVWQDADGGDDAASSFTKPKKSKKSKSSKKKSRSHAPVSDGVDTPDSSAMVKTQLCSVAVCANILY